MDLKKTLFIFLCIVFQFLKTSWAQDADSEATPPGVDGGVVGVEGGGKGSDAESGTGGTTDGVYREQTNMPESDFDDALHLEVGEFSTVSYSYFNDQFINWHKPGAYNCYDDYIKCLLSQTLRHPVCAMHRADYRPDEGYKHLPSMCDLFWYNCRKGYRYFYVMKYGVCAYHHHGKHYMYYQGRK